MYETDYIPVLLIYILTVVLDKGRCVLCITRVCCWMSLSGPGAHCDLLEVLVADIMCTHLSFSKLPSIKGPTSLSKVIVTAQGQFTKCLVNAKYYLKKKKEKKKVAPASVCLITLKICLSFQGFL